MKYKTQIHAEQSFTGKIYKVDYRGRYYFIGVTTMEEGASIYFPQAGSEYLLVMLNERIYRFMFSEFDSPVGFSYIAEKLACSIDEAELVYNVVNDFFLVEDAKELLDG